MSASGFDFDLFDAAEAGVYAAPNEDLPSLAMAARDAGLHTLEVDLAGCRDKQTLLLRMAHALDVPAGSGRNWDALSDLLRDLSWLGQAQGHVLLLVQLEDLHAAAPEVYDTLLDILHETVQSWGDNGIPFWVFAGVSDVPPDPETP